MGPPLFEALIANAVFLCDADALLHWNSAAEEGASVHQIQPRAKETYLKRGQKVDPLEIKSGPPWRVQFCPFIVANLLKRLFQVEADLPATAATRLES